MISGRHIWAFALATCFGMAPLASYAFDTQDDAATTKQKQKEVAKTTEKGYPQKGAKAGDKANEDRAKSDQPPALATTKEKQQAVATTTEKGYPQKGAKAGEKANEDRATMNEPPASQ